MHNCSQKALETWVIIVTSTVSKLLWKTSWTGDGQYRCDPGKSILLPLYMFNSWIQPNQFKGYCHGVMCYNFHWSQVLRSNDLHQHYKEPPVISFYQAQFPWGIALSLLKLVIPAKFLLDLVVSAMKWTFQTDCSTIQSHKSVLCKTARSQRLK